MIIDHSGHIAGLKDAKRQIDSAREFLRGSTYSADRLINLMHHLIDGAIEDLQKPEKELCKRGDTSEC